MWNEGLMGSVTSPLVLRDDVCWNISHRRFVDLDDTKRLVEAAGRVTADERTVVATPT
jgi:hypothetical protein